jgi:hypothetical protein
MIATTTDARRAMREALHRLVHEAEHWSQPSLAVFRNRLLDEVSSDARPLANLLVEAIDRGVLDALPRRALTPGHWSARSTPFVNRWVADRFLQPEVARWAVEAWGYALGCIDTSQLTASVDAPEPEPLTPQWPARRVEGAGTSATPVRTVAPAGGLTAPPSTGGAAPWRGAAPAMPRPAARPVPYTPYRPPSRVGSASSTWAVANASRVAIGTAAIAVASYIYIFASAALRPERERTATTALAAPPAASERADDLAPVLGGIAASTGLPGDGTEIPTTYSVVERQAPGGDADGAGRPAAPLSAATGGIGVGGQPTLVPLAPGSGTAPSLAMTRLPAEGATPNAYLELAARSAARSVAGTDDERARAAGAGATASPTAPAPATPGVPGITRNALPVTGDLSRVQRVQPATRPAPRLVTDAAAATGGRLPNTVPTREAGAAGRPSTPAPASPRATAAAPSATAPSATAPAGASRAPATPGLDQLRLGSGRRITGRVEVIRTASVVFRDAETGLRYEFAKDDIDEIITEFGNAVRFRQRGPSASRDDRRTVSVAGRYAVTYEAARVNGSPACRDLWRGPSGSDAAEVRHRAGDDTLSVAFVGGDVFPSVLDADGFFSSTFRIMPGQEQLATALTTRLNGRFEDDGALTLQVNVIGYRRVRGTQGVACHIIVDARGSRVR